MALPRPAVFIKEAVREPLRRGGHADPAGDHPPARTDREAVGVGEVHVPAGLSVLNRAERAVDLAARAIHEVDGALHPRRDMHVDLLARADVHPRKAVDPVTAGGRAGADIETAPRAGHRGGGPPVRHDVLRQKLKGCRHGQGNRQEDAVRRPDRRNGRHHWGKEPGHKGGNRKLPTYFRIRFARTIRQNIVLLSYALPKRTGNGRFSRPVAGNGLDSADIF